ncbi:hypothetical protein BC835DRAFT_1373425 [Cytidiella melzeri]|nr:hypothetical protein BC835DRAFT_1373425 [Cytidiella melzeri]
MDLLQNVESSASPIDSQQYQSFQSADVSSYPSVLNGTRSDPTLNSALPAHISAPAPSMFSSELHSAETMGMSMQMPSSSLSSMDVVPPGIPDHLSANMLTEFSPQTPAVSASATASLFLPDPAMNGIETMDTPHQMSSSSSTGTASTSASLVSSPSVNGMVNPFMMGTSSLATALDGPRSRSASSASPSHPTVLSSELGFASSNSAPSTTSTNETSFPFSSGYEQPFTAPQSKENSPDAMDPHLLALGDMLKNIAKTASSGSEACTNGRSSSAATLVDQLTKHVLLVAKMAARMNLSDQPTGSPTTGSSPHASNGPASNGTPPSSTGLDGSQDNHLNGLAGFESSRNNTSLDSTSLLDTSDMSRKRCASTLEGDRVTKAMKMEPSDEIPLSMPPPPVHSHSAPHLNVSPSFTFSAPTSIPPSMATIVEHPSIPPLSSSVPGTRPPSSSGMPHPALHSHPSTHFPPHLDFVQSLAHPPTDFTSLTNGPASAPAPLASTSFASGAGVPGTGWSESRPIVGRQSHSLSGVPGSVSGMPSMHPTPLPLSTNLTFPPAVTSYNSPTHPIMPTQQPPPLLGRVSRSGSMSHTNPFAFGIDVTPLSAAKATFDSMQSRPSTSGGIYTRGPSPEYDDDEDRFDDDSDDEHHTSPQHPQYTSSNGPSPGDGGNDSSQSQTQNTSARRGSRTSPSADTATSNHNNEIPQEYKADVEQIFFEFLSKTCSNLDATDSKGEPIHQTLMAKKMQRLDESPDFRPFKFRIQAFTNAFLEELARQGYPEEKIPMKKIRNFLWNQPYISRFNEEGKKSKSKGNHIWHVDGKRTDAGWTFRPFQRKLAGVPPGVAYIGLRWSWTPRIWDPQASRANMPVTYTSPALPPWLAWDGDTLSGIPTPDAESCDVTVQARFIQDGQEETLSHTVHVNIAPMTAVDASFTPSRRPSLVGDIHNPRRFMSDSVLPQTSPPRAIRAPPPLAPGPASGAPDSQVVQVLTTAAQRVAQEAQSQVVASPNEAGPELHSLAKQQHVLTVTAQAVNNKSNGDPPAGSSTQSNALAAAAQQVVLQAARQVAADRTSAAVSSGIAPADAAHAVASQVTVKEVSVATQSAVAQAVEMVGPLSSEVDVLMTAKSLLQQQTRVSTMQPLQPMPPSGLNADLTLLDPTRSAGAQIAMHFPPLPSLTSFYAA